MLSIEHIVEAIGKAWRFFTGETETARAAILRAFEDNFDALVIVGEDGRIITANRTASRLLLVPNGSSLTARSASEILPEPLLRAVQQSFSEGRKGVPTPITPARIGDPKCLPNSTGSACAMMPASGSLMRCHSPILARFFVVALMATSRAGFPC